MSILHASLLALCLLVQPTLIEPVRESAASASEQGMIIRRSTDTAGVLVPWFKLRDQAPPQYSNLALRAWRAHSRLQRGDISGAMPLYLTLGSEYMWERGPQSMDVCDGLVICLVDSGRRIQSIDPMLAWFEAESLPGSMDASVPSKLHPTMRVRMDLPPVFSQQDSGPLDELGEVIGDRTRLIHAYYALVLAQPQERQGVINQIDELKRRYRSRDPGLVFLEQMSFAQAHPEASSRLAAQDSLKRRTDSQSGTWIEVWSRLALGVSWIRGEDLHARDRGVVELVHIIVRLAMVEPGLTLLAADIANQYLESTQRGQWGSRLMQDARQNLITNFDAHGAAGEGTQ